MYLFLCSHFMMELVHSVVLVCQSQDLCFWHFFKKYIYIKTEEERRKPEFREEKSLGASSVAALVTCYCFSVYTETVDSIERAG